MTWNPDRDLYQPGFNAEAVAYVFAHVRGLKPGPMAVLLAIAQHVNDGTSLSRVGGRRSLDLAGLGTTAVDEALKLLKARGHLVRLAQKGDYGINEYALPCLDYVPSPVLTDDQIRAEEMKAGAAKLMARSKPQGSESEAGNRPPTTQHRQGRRERSSSSSSC
jgi:hypothetical protein